MIKLLILAEVVVVNELSIVIRSAVSKRKLLGPQCKNYTGVEVVIKKGVRSFGSGYNAML